MATTKEKKVAPKKAAPKKAAKAAPKKRAADGLVTFAIRLPKANRNAFHKAAGPGKASKVARLLIDAFAGKSDASYAAITKTLAAK